MIPESFPRIDVGPLVSPAAGTAARAAVADEIRRACARAGFFYATGHGVDPDLPAALLRASRAFFALEPGAKEAISMSRGGRAWRGYFPVGAELTSGRPDRKEGLYFGAELGPGDPRVRAALPLHGPNLFPPQVPELRAAVLAWIDAMIRLGHALVAGIALGLGLDPGAFRARFFADPLVLLRVFHYPPGSDGDDAWGVGEHTDYGMLTILLQDDVGGLQVRSGERWIDAPPLPGSFVCNVGDMLDRMTGGRYRSVPHRVRNLSGRGRLSIPFFFDPSFDARVERVAGAGADAEAPPDDRAGRWDGESVHDFEGTYGDYLLRKVARVFPHLGRAVL